MKLNKILVYETAYLLLHIYLSTLKNRNYYAFNFIPACIILKLRPIVIQEVKKMIACGTIDSGFILTLHTFGKALNFNPHIHCLVTEGGMDENHHYKAIHYINYETLRKSFMKQPLDNIKKFYADNPNYLHKIKSLIN